MRALVGFLAVDKAGGWTSHDVVAKARGVFSTRKIGHAGTLDPMATGLIVLGLGRATRLLRFIQGQEKEYVATAQFGVATDTLDADGDEVSRAPIEISESDLRGALGGFVGDISQVPPMVSAIQIDGRRLYDLARKGEEVERPPRPVRIESFELESFIAGSYPEATFRIVCGTGTYVRSLCDDLAQALGGRAHLTALRRVRNGRMSVSEATSIDDLMRLASTDELEATVISPVDALGHMPRVDVSGDILKVAENGGRIPPEAWDKAIDDAFVRVVGEGRLVGVYRIDGTELVPEVVLG